MGSRHEDVVLAIPTYNNVEGLVHALDAARQENFSDVVVLDDGSTDDTLSVLKRDFTGEVRIISNGKNLGPAGNRNRIMYDELSRDSILHFTDDDSVLTSTEVPENIRTIFEGRENIGYIGGMVLNACGRQMPANYGPRFSLMSQWVEQALQGVLYGIGGQRPELSNWLRGKLSLLLEDWPNSDERPAPELKQVFGATEANMMIRAKTLRRFGGFNKHLRYFEGAELALRMEEDGSPRYFFPGVEITLNDEIGLMEGISRLPTMIRWSIPIIGEMGLTSYILGR